MGLVSRLFPQHCVLLLKPRRGICATCIWAASSSALDLGRSQKTPCLHFLKHFVIVRKERRNVDWIKRNLVEFIPTFFNLESGIEWKHPLDDLRFLFSVCFLNLFQPPKRWCTRDRVLTASSGLSWRPVQVKYSQWPSRRRFPYSVLWSNPKEQLFRENDNLTTCIKS